MHPPRPSRPPTRTVSRERSPGLAAFQAARACGLPALEATALALAAEAAHAPHARRKRHVRDALALGLSSRACRARYGAHLDAMADRGLDLDGAITATACQLRRERARRDRVLQLGYPAPPRLPLMVLDELRLLLRYLRRRDPSRLSEILAPEPGALAAE